MNDLNTWGKFWTYLLFAAIVSTGWGFAYFLRYEKNVQNNHSFMKVSDANYQQLQLVRAYIGGMPSGQTKHQLDSITKNIWILRSTGDTIIGGRIYDRDSILSLPVDTIPEVVEDPVPEIVWVPSRENIYMGTDATNPVTERNGTGTWQGINGGTLSVHGKYRSAGNYAIEVDGSTTPGSGAGTTISLDSTKRYNLSIDVRKNVSNEVILRTFADQELLEETTTVANSSDGAGYNSYLFKINNKKAVTFSATFTQASASGKEIYIDNIILNPHVPKTD